MLKRIAITGPESSGKTHLAKELAQYFKTKWVSEYARDYLSGRAENYSIDDILSIAKGQFVNEEKMAQSCENLLFCDTDLTVTKVWSQVVFKTCPQWIEQKFLEHQYDLYLLCYPDINWESDPLRENPTDRLYIFDLYQKELKSARFNYKIVEGRGEVRLKNAINFVNQLLSNSA